MKISILFVLTFWLNLCHSQITGSIIDQEKEALPGASIVAKQNGKIIKGELSDFNGKFSIMLDEGIYDLEISFISYQTEIKKIKVEKSPLDLGIIQLKPSNTSLNEVTIEGEANLVEFKQDKRVYNIAKDLSSAGANASEVLDNIPSVDVDIDGNISLRGSQNVRILIDGKPSGLIGTDPATALRSLQSNMIERVEVITNPSARYEAQGEAGIINIVLKKNRENGFNGNFEISAGSPDLYGAAAGLNYRTGKLNFFANLGFNYRNSPGGGFTKQTFNLSDTSYAFNSTRNQTRGRSTSTLRFGADYQLTQNQSLTGTFLFRPSDGNNRVEIDYDDFNENDVLTERQSRIDDENEKKRTLEGDIHYEKTLEGKDHKWTMDLRVQDSDDREDSEIQQINSFGSANEYQRVNNQEDEQSFLFQTDYIKPFSKIRGIELGARYNFRNIINNYQVSQLNESGVYENLDLYTNNFNYVENIAAAYAIYNDGIGDKITYQLGLRGEYTGLETELVKENISNPREYFNLFPSVFFTWKMSERGDLQWSYSRRISRPNFRSLLPFFSFSDNRNFFSGNPNLNPEFTDSYEIGHVRYIGNATIYAGVYYRHRTGVTERIRTVNDSGFTEIFPINLAVQDAYGVELTYSQSIFDWWKINANANIYQANNKGEYEGIDYGSENFSARGRFMSRFTFWDSDLQASFNFRAPQTTAQGRSEGIYTADLGWSKDLFKGNATLTLSIRDVFNSRRRRSFSTGDNFTTKSEFQWRARQFTATLIYRLNQKKQREKRGEGMEDDDFGS